MNKFGKVLVGTLCVAAAAGAAKGIERAVWLHNYCKLDPYTVDSIANTNITEEQDVKMIAHRGFRAMAPENTLPAYEAAGKAGFWGAECDTYMTKDGVWVLHHDPYTYRMMNKTRSLEKSTYDELMALDYTNGHNIDQYPHLKICTLEDFFKTCAKYNMHAVVELKYNRNLEHYDKIIALQKQYGVDATYIAFSFEDLVRLRELTDAPLYYLVYDIKDEDIEKAKTLTDCGISYDGNEKKNLANDGAMIKKCHEAGLQTATWAVDDLSIIETLVGYGTKYITTNAITY